MYIIIYLGSYRIENNVSNMLQFSSLEGNLFFLLSSKNKRALFLIYFFL